jgi:hypothetical protein
MLGERASGVPEPERCLTLELSCERCQTKVAAQLPPINSERSTASASVRPPPHAISACTGSEAASRTRATSTARLCPGRLRSPNFGERSVIVWYQASAAFVRAHSREAARRRHQVPRPTAATRPRATPPLVGVAEYSTHRGPFRTERRTRAPTPVPTQSDPLAQLGEDQSGESTHRNVYTLTPR